MSNNPISKDLYPSKSTIIDLRNKISTPQTSKTKQFFDELDKLSGSRSKFQFTRANKTCEVERWFNPRSDDGQDSGSLPPSRSLFTPSRLQDISILRNREIRKPYWRCPKPVDKITSAETSLSNIEQLLRKDTTTEVDPSPYSSRLSAHKPPPIKSFTRRREPERGRKPNIFNVDEEDLVQESIGGINASELDKVGVLPLPKVPEAGFLTKVAKEVQCDVMEIVDEDSEFTFVFSEPLIRGPKCPTPPPQPQLQVTVANDPQEKEKLLKNIHDLEKRNSSMEKQIDKLKQELQQLTGERNDTSTKLCNENQQKIREAETTKLCNENEQKIREAETKAHQAFQTQQVSRGFQFGTTVPTTFGTTVSTTFGTTVPTTFGTTAPTTFGTTVPTTFGTTAPTTFGTTAPTTFGTTAPTTFGATVPTTFGTTEFQTQQVSRGFQFGTTVPTTSNGHFQFGAAPISNGTFRFAETTTTAPVDSSSVGGVRTSVAARKLLQARRSRGRR